MQHEFNLKFEPIGGDKAEVLIGTTSWGGQVLLFMPRTTLTPEELATLQAMYSRSNQSIVKRLAKLLEDQKLDATKDRILAQTFSGYGHKSIGDLGNILICFEGISMLAAKAIQDSQLYAGQESSTRYITFDKQPFLVAEGGILYKTTTASNINPLSNIMEELRVFYLASLPKVQNHLFALYPWEEQGMPEDKKPDYERAIKARAFDIMRGFLPAGCSTNVAWWTSISHCSDQIGWLRCHPLAELREVAAAVYEIVSKMYPSSFATRTVYEEREIYKSEFYEKHYYLEAMPNEKKRWRIDTDQLLEWKTEIMNRPKGQEFPYQIGECGDLLYAELLDFGSFRDQQRRRAVGQRQGLLTHNFGFHPWYIENLPEDLRAEALEMLEVRKQYIESLEVSKFEKQYLVPMGYQLPTQLNGHLGKVFYFLELRAQTTVHPTLHANAYECGLWVKDKLAAALDVPVDKVPLYMNPDVGAFSLKRGSQTFFVAGKAISDE